MSTLPGMSAANCTVRAIYPPAKTTGGTKENAVAESPSAGFPTSTVVAVDGAAVGEVVEDVELVVPVGDVVLVVLVGEEVVVVLLVVVLVGEEVVVVLVGVIVVVVVGEVVVVVVVVVGDVVVVVVVTGSTIVAVVVTGLEMNPSMSTTVSSTRYSPAEEYLWLTVALELLLLLPSPKTQRYCTTRPPSVNAVPRSCTFSPTTPV